jgi:hypothetical protein
MATGSESLIQVPHISAAHENSSNRTLGPDSAARKLVEIANASEPAQDGRRHRTGHRIRLAVAARIRDLCEVTPAGDELFA